MKKKLVALCVMAATVVSLAACGSKDTVTEGQNTSDKQVVVEHSKGTTVVSGEVKKAVVFDLSVLDTMDALGVDAEVAIPTANLVSYLSDYSTAVNAGGIKEPDMETIFAFEPDVIFINGRQESFYDELNKIAPTIYVDLTADNYMNDFSDNVRMIGEIFGKEDVAEEKLAEIQQLVDETKELASTTEDNALILLTNDGGISAYGMGSRFGIIHDVLGIKQADESIKVSTHGQEASYEYISKVDADILFVIDRTAIAGGTVDASQTLNNAVVNKTKAAQNGKIISLDPECWYTSGGGLTSVRVMVEEVKTAIQ